LTDCESSELKFNNVTIAGDAAFSGSTFGSLEFKDSAARSLTFTGGYDEKKAPVPLATDHLSLRGSQFRRLHFDSYRHREDPVAFLPSFVDMGGATYDSLPRVGMASDPKQLLSFRKKLVSGYYTDHDPQPYFQMARQLRASGYLTEANRFQYLERKAARRDARRRGKLGQYLWLTALAGFIGYGIGNGYFRAFGWVVLFTVVGAIVLGYPTAQGERHGLIWRLGASLDQVLPVAKLSPEYTEFFKGATLSHWQNLYFIVHRLMGWLLATFVVAGLAGLTQKPN
jgi:hypothetical protein